MAKRLPAAPPSCTSRPMASRPWNWTTGASAPIWSQTPQGVHGREWMAKVPFVALAMGGLTLGLYTLNKRRAEVAALKSQEKPESKEA